MPKLNLAFLDRPFGPHFLPRLRQEVVGLWDDYWVDGPENKKMRIAAKLLAFFLVFILLPLQAGAVSGNWQRDGEVDARLISSLEGVGTKSTIPLGLEVHMGPGWHTYWRSPGATGLPPDIDWSGSLSDQGNLKSAAMLFPLPKRYNEQGMDTIGYQSRVVFPIDAELRRPGRALDIDATVHLLACNDICVPKTFNLKLTVPHDSAIEGPEADILNPARLLVPGSDQQSTGLSVTGIANTGKNLIFAIASTAPLTGPDLLIESQPEIGFSAPEWKVSPKSPLAGTFTVKLLDPKKDLAKLADTPLTLTLIDGSRAVEIASAIPDIAGSGSNSPLLSFRAALLLAVIGGFLLNLMPCVLPVLSLKILSLIGHGGGEARIVRRSFLMTAAGIMFSFLVLAGATILLKQLGMTMGWGIQFQQPVFLIVLILLLTVFTANMWGLYEINLPGFLADRLSAHHPKMAGDFATGALATLLATPCTAPFMGTAVGFALASGTVRQIVAIFVALGFGMTIPYFSIAIFPELAIYLPKPGAWMARLRAALGIPLALTVGWLLWVLAAQIQPVYALTVGICMAGIIASLGVLSSGKKSILARVGLVALAVIAVSLSLGGTPPSNPHHKAEGGDEREMEWQAFDTGAIPIQVASGHIVFVDITADWCLTCKTNKKFVLSTPAISQRLFHSNVVPMQGDWTNPNEQIAGFLQKYRRAGIPFDIVYGPGAPEGITLPEILTSDVVTEALDKAATP
jgi:suppressor for copper-sensitivity B